ncbi:MAG: hypothetical protein WD272_01235 [Balneolales bacterium]
MFEKNVNETVQLMFPLVGYTGDFPYRANAPGLTYYNTGASE